MRFLIDAQLPKRLAIWLNSAGHDALHTLDLPQANASSDAQIIERAEQDGRVVVSKDDDFVQSFWLHGKPKLLLIATGNIRNIELETLLQNNMANIEQGFASASFIEMTRTTLVVHA